MDPNNQEDTSPYWVLPKEKPQETVTAPVPDVIKKIQKVVPQPTPKHRFQNIPEYDVRADITKNITPTRPDPVPVQKVVEVPKFYRGHKGVPGNRGLPGRDCCMQESLFIDLSSSDLRYVPGMIITHDGKSMIKDIKLDLNGLTIRTSKNVESSRLICYSFQDGLYSAEGSMVNPNEVNHTIPQNASGMGNIIIIYQR